MPALAHNIRNIRKLNTHTDEFAKTLFEIDLQWKNKLKQQLNVTEKYQRFEDVQDSSRITGMMQFEKIWEVLHKIETIKEYGGKEGDYKYKLSVDQKKYAKEFIIGMINIIFSQEEKSIHMPELMAKYNFTEIKPINLLTTYRRFGKSFLMAILTVCAAMAINDVTILNFAPGLRSACRQMDIMRDILIDYNGGSEHGIIESYSKTQYLNVVNCWGRVSHVKALPGNSSIGV